MDFLQTAFIQNFGTQELILIFLVVLLFFGAKRMPELFRSFGKSIKEFKKAASDVQDDIRTAMEAEDEPSKKPAKTPLEETQPTSEPEKQSAEESPKKSD